MVNRLEIDFGVVYFQVIAFQFNGVIFKTKESVKADVRFIGFKLEGDGRFFVTIVARAPSTGGVGVGADDGEFRFAFHHTGLDQYLGVWQVTRQVIEQ